MTRFPIAFIINSHAADVCGGIFLKSRGPHTAEVRATLAPTVSFDSASGFFEVIGVDVLPHGQANITSSQLG